MGVSSGPYNPRDGLVLWYDIANSLSFKGEPVTNFFQNGHFSNGQGIPGEAGSNPTNDIVRFPNPGDSDWVLRQTGPGPYTEYQINLTTQLSSSTTYVMSGWYAESNDYQGADGSRMFHARAFSSTGAHQATGNGIGTVIETKVVAGIIWKYCYQTITTPSNYSNQFDWYLGYGNFTFSGNRYYTNIQLEQGTYPKKFANGTRGTTVALGGGIQDLTGKGNNAELINGPTASTLNGGFIILDGTNDYCSTSVANLPIGAAARTLSLWFRYVDYSSTFFSVCGYGAESTGRTFDIIITRSTQKLNLDSYGGGYGIVTTTSVLPGVWYHVSAVYTGTEQRLYLNGVLESSQVKAIDTASSNLILGKVTWGTPGYLKGDIAHFSLYNKALSATEISQLYQSLRTRFISRQSIVTSGLVLHLDAGNINSYKGSGTTWSDLSGYGNIGTLTNGPVYKTGNGGYIQFDGVNDYINCGNVLANLVNLTLECWINFRTQLSLYNGIISKTLDNSNGYELRTTGYTSTTTDFQFRYIGDSAATGDYTATNGVWYHILATGESGAQRLYINGVLFNSASVASTPASNSNNLSIGKLSYAGLYVNANIAFVRIYNRALSASEVLQNYEATKARFNK